AYAGVAAVSGSTETAAASHNGTYVIYGDSDKVYRFHGKAPAAQELEVLFYDGEDAEVLQRDMVWNEETLRHEADIARADFTGAVRVAMRVKENAEGITGRESGFALKQVTAGYLVVNEAPSFDGAAGTVLAPGDNVKFNFSAPTGSEWQKRVILNYKTTAGDDETKTAAEALLEEWNSTISIPNSAASLVSMRYELYNVANDMVTNMVEYGLSAYSVEAPVSIYAYDIPDAYEGTILRISGTDYNKTVYLDEDVLFALDNSGYDIGEMPDGDYTWEISGASGYIASGSFTHSRGDDLDLSYDLPELGSLTVTTNGFTSEKEAAGSTEANAKYLTVNPQAKVIANFTMADGTTHKVVGKTGQKMDQIPLGSTGTVTLEWDPEASDEISGVSPASYNVTINGDESRIFEYQKFTFRTIKGFLHYFDEYRNYGYTPWSARITLKQTVTRGGKTETIIRTASPAKAANPWQTQGTFSFTCYDNIPATIEIRSMEYDPKTIEITENGDQNLGQVNLTTGGERTVLVKVNYTTANTVNSKGEQYFENIGSSQVPIDSGFVSIASVGDWENRYYAGSTDKYSTYIENGQTYIHINEGVVKKERTLSVFGSGKTSLGGSEVVVRGNGDVVFDEMGVGTVTLNAYTNGGEVRATVVDSNDTAYMGFLCIVNGGYTYIHEDGTEEVIKHCEFVSGRGELVYPYSTTDNLARTRQVFTVKCRAEDAEDLADELSGNVNKFIELGEGTGKDQVILRNVKFQANTTVIFEDAKPTNFIRTAGLSPWIFDYQFELTEDIDTVRLTGVLYKRFPDMPNSDILEYLRLYIIEGMNQIPVEFTANGRKTVESYKLNPETGDYDIPNHYWNSGYGTYLKPAPVSEVRITADLPLNYAFNKVHFQLSAELTSGLQVFDKDDTVPMFTLSVPNTVSIMDRMGA
ncbi:MAG: hypothetical protein IKI65_03260, partial [Firmicutes bacterium]|nr:hypothetical protein [Bacillota bacterium]